MGQSLVYNQYTVIIHVAKMLVSTPEIVKLLSVYILFSGYYVRLKDKSLQVSDRLKLVRYAWIANQIFIPNKEQVLIDLLFGLLINRKRYLCQNLFFLFCSN